MVELLYVSAGLLAVTAVVATVAARLGQSVSILLVVAGIVLALIPGASSVALAPDLVLLLFLPPIIYIAAFQMSWQAFCDNLRTIALLAVEGVLTSNA